MEKKWINQLTTDTKKYEEVSDALNIPSLTSRIMYNRGINTIEKAKKFLYPEITDLYDPYIFKDMDKIVKRIERAIENNEPIWVYGDYDVDGMTSISILVNYFNAIGYNVNYYIPNRQKEGYGISKKGINEIFNNQGKLIITVDCGITAHEMVDYCNELNMDIIITDHHTCGETLPQAYGILNPKVTEDPYPYDMLAGVGISLKLVQGMLGESFYDVHKDYMDIAAFGTIADIVPLKDENRIITKIGLKYINAYNNPGLKALIEVSDLKDKEISTGIIGFRLAPQLNAAGRLGKPELGVELLTSHDPDKLMTIAKELNQLNEQRKLIEKAIFIKAKKYIEKNIDLENTPILVVYGENWHSGVIGIVASRLVEEYLKPAIVLSKEEDFVKGSARSVGNLSIYDCLKAVSSDTIGFGGHKMAAGLTMNAEHVNDFRKNINAFVRENIDPEDLRPIVKYEGDIKGSDVSLEKIKSIDQLKPFGVGNPKPMFNLASAQVIDAKCVGKEGSHLKVLLSKDSAHIDGIGFSLGHFYEPLKSHSVVDALVSLDINEYNGIVTPQLLLKDFKFENASTNESPKIKESHDNGIYIEYLKSLYLSLKNNLSYFMNIDFERLEMKKDSIKDMDMKTLILVHALDSLDTDKWSTYDDWKIHFNKIEKSGSKDILINPVLKNINIHAYEQIIFYDIPVRNPKEQLVSFINGNRLNCLKNIFKNIPSKNELVRIYKEILLNPELEFNHLKKTMGYSNITVILALELFKELSLIDFNFNGSKVSLEILPKPKKKVSIEEYPTFISLQKLKRKVI